MLPKYELRTKYEDDKPWIWDQIRKKWLVWQPEEAVRQQLICYLTEEKNISPALIGVEKEVKYHKIRKRFDLVVFDRNGVPFILIECKAPEVQITKAALQQVAMYNATLEAPYLLLFNGHQWAFFSKDDQGIFQFVPRGWYDQ